MEAHLQKIQAINVVFPRGLKIGEEEHFTPGKDSSASFFNNYERELSIKRFFNAKLKCNRDLVSHIGESRG